MKVILRTLIFIVVVAVMMAHDQDLKQMGLSKGPRIKILRSMDSRRQAMESKENKNDTAF